MVIFKVIQNQSSLGCFEKQTNGSYPHFWLKNWSEEPVVYKDQMIQKTGLERLPCDKLDS